MGSRYFINSICSFIPEIIFEKIYYILRRKEYKSLEKSIDLINNKIYRVEHQEFLLNNILEYVFENCKYYNDIFSKMKEKNYNSKIDYFKCLPITDKEFMKENFDKIIVKDFKERKKLKMNTGGTTGDPFEFYRSLEQGIIDRICLKNSYKDMGYINKDKIITFNGSNIKKNRIKRNIFWSRKGPNIPYGSINFSSIYLTDNNIKLYIKQLNKLKPTILRGYPSFIYDLGKYIVDNEIELGYKLKGIQLTSEMTSYEQLETIKRAFKTKVFFQYGHSEACIFAIAEEDMKYYCNPYYGYVEVVNESGNHINIGEVGYVVVTSFYNKVMPFIRYNTGDMAEYGGVDNGFVILNKLYGRSQDFIYNQYGEKFALTALIFGQHLNSFKNIKKWQLEQEDFVTIKLNIVKDILYNSLDEIELRKHFENKCKLKVKFNYVNHIELNKNGKFRFLIQNAKK